MAKTALLIIDLQNDYFPGGKWTLHNIEAAARKAGGLLNHFRQEGLPVIHVRHSFSGPDAPFFAEGSPGAEINETVRPVVGEAVVHKQQVNAFHETDLKAVLDQAKIEDLVICGAMSHMCVDAATRAASDLGYRCTVIHDACAAKDLDFDGKTIAAAEVHAAYMSALGFAYAKVCSAEAFLAADS